MPQSTSFCCCRMGLNGLGKRTLISLWLSGLPHGDAFSITFYNTSVQVTSNPFHLLVLQTHSSSYLTHGRLKMLFNKTKNNIYSDYIFEWITEKICFFLFEIEKKSNFFHLFGEVGGQFVLMNINWNVVYSIQGSLFCSVCMWIWFRIVTDHHNSLPRVNGILFSNHHYDMPVGALLHYYEMLFQF